MIEVSDRLTFCLNCFRQIDREAIRCPFCGIEADRWHETDYVARLSHALEHPLDDVRMRAIIALGWLGEPQTETALVDCAFAHPTDVTNGLEVVRSLGEIAERHGCRNRLLRLSRRIRHAGCEEQRKKYWRRFHHRRPAVARKLSAANESPRPTRWFAWLAR